MTVILVPANGDDMQINWWNWRPLVALMVRADVLPVGEREERCLANGCGGYLSAAEAKSAAEHIESLIAELSSNEGVLLDGEVTTDKVDHDKPISEFDESDKWVIYSAKRQVLERFAEFCRKSGGFEVL